VLAVVRRPERAAALQESYGVGVVTAAEAAKTADTLVITVKPQDMTALLDEIAPHVPADRLIISVAAGFPTSRIENQLGAAVPVVRVMSNTPVLVDEAMSVISAGAHAARSTCAGPRNCCGRSAGCCASPSHSRTRLPRCRAAARYVYFLVEAMVDAGILLGMPRGTALEMVTQAVYGAATMLRESGEHPVILREAVTSPGGTTISAIRELENHRVRAAFLAAIEAARDRGAELGSG
jgi:pyrroline-5-carboxylate reductase